MDKRGHEVSILPGLPRAVGPGIQARSACAEDAAWSNLEPPRRTRPR